MGSLRWSIVSAASVDGLYTTDAEIAGYFALMEGNPTLTAMNGPGFGAEAPNIGAILVNEVLLFGCDRVRAHGGLPGGPPHPG